jgi:hypothetical protein
MQDFSVESKTSGISSLSTSWQDLEARYKSSNEVNMTPRSLRTKPEKMKNFEDPVRKLPNLVGQGASSNPKRNWRQGPTCSWGKTLEDLGIDTGQRRLRTGLKWAQAGRPSPFRGPFPPFDLTASQAIYIPEARRHAKKVIRHLLPRSREERDTISERRGLS